jgi:hypothetical protein
MGRVRQLQKDNLINEIDDKYELNLSDEDYESLRRLSTADIFFIDKLINRALKNKEKDDVK